LGARDRDGPDGIRDIPVDELYAMCETHLAKNERCGRSHPPLKNARAAYASDVALGRRLAGAEPRCQAGWATKLHPGRAHRHQRGNGKRSATLEAEKVLAGARLTARQ
jgi:hypothetical protein